MNFDPNINGKHYTEYIEYLEKQIEDGFLNEAKILLLKILDKMEEYSFKVGEPVAPAYYKMLNSIYKKEKDREGQEKSLYRYLIQIKARGVSAKKMFDTYKKINPNIDSIYPDYLLNLKKCEVPIFSYTCPHCKEQIKLPKILSPSPARKDYTSIFGTSCPKCFESFITV